MQQFTPNKPIKLVTDKNDAHIGADEATYLHNYRINFNKNQLEAGKEGGNLGVGTGYNSNTLAVPSLLLPAGVNHNIGRKEYVDLNQIYFLNWNANGNHGIYRINGDTLTWELIIVDPRLNFSRDPKHAIPAHRISIKAIYNSDDDSNRVIKEIQLKYIDGYNWQRWINVESAIATKGFDSITYPYFKLQYPHYDFEELIDWPVRPPMFCPQVSEIPADGSSLGKANQIENKSVQFAIVFLLTDGRSTTLSPYSTPYTYTKAGCSVNSSSSVRCLELTLNVGGAHVESIQILVRNCSGEWKLYDTIDKFNDTGVNNPVNIGNRYWLRTNPWADYSYDTATNTIKYKYCGDKECSLYSINDALRFQTDMPINSIAMAEAGDAMLLGNNLYDYDNLSKDILSKIKLNVQQDDASSSCNIKTVNIKVYAYLSRNCSGENGQFLWKPSADSTDIRFGGAATAGNQFVMNNTEPDIFNLKTNGREGFICYLAGTSYFSVGKQFLLRNNIREDLGVIDISNAEQMAAVKDVVTNKNGIFLQEFEFNVPAGKYLARLADHNVSIEDAYEKTSTYIGGIGSPTDIVGRNLSTINSVSKEVNIDASEGDVTFFDSKLGTFYVFVPWSRDYFRGQDYGRFITGYLTEKTADSIPVERVVYDRTHGGAPYIQQGSFTDCNGFFWSLSGGGSANTSQVGFFPKLNCTSPNISGSPTFTTNITGSAAGFFPKQDKTIQGSIGGAYGSCNRVLVRGQVLDCTSGQGLGGIGITLQNTATYYTNSEGYFEAIIHSMTSGNRFGKIYFNGNISCAITNCDCTIIDTVDYDESLVSCTNCQERVYPIVFNKSFKVQGQIKPSQKSGGRYGIGIALADLAGRSTYEQVIDYVDIPTIMDKGQISPSKIAWALTAPLNLPDNFAFLSFFITKNLNNKRYLQWVGDKIDFLDIDGDSVPSGNGAILAKITIQSLLDYNVANNFSVNTIYQFATGDRIRFIDNGSGVILKPDDKGYLDYVIRGTDFDSVESTTTDETPDGKSILIDYDSRLLSLKSKCGFWIELISPRACEDLESYCEVCGTYPIIDGNIVSTGAVLNAFDTYYVNRKIIISRCSGGGSTHSFESSSISDYYGTDCDSCGRLLVKDKKAEQVWYEDDVIKSDDFVNEGRVNGLGTFRSSNRKKFKGSEWGGLVAMKAERGLVAFICQNDFFIANYQYNFVRTTNTGILQADLDTNLSEPNQKVGDNFGCNYDQTSTINFFNGTGMWADAKNSAIMLMDFARAVDISKIDNKSWFINKFKYVYEFNKSLSESTYLDNLIDVVAGIDPESNRFFITFKPRNGMNGSILDFVVNEHDFFLDAAETMVYDIEQKEWVGTVGFAPEGYGMLRQSTSGMEMVTFATGKPYFHNTKTIKNVNEFYGVKTDTVIEIVTGKTDEAKEKLIQSITIESRGVLFYISQVLTNQNNLFSYVPVPYLYKKANVYDAAMLRNMNIYQDPNNEVESTLIDGGVITGLWSKIKLVKDLKNRDIYTEINYIWLRYIPLEKSKK